MKKRWIVICLLLCITASLSACGSDASFEDNVMEELSAFEGQSSFYYKNLETGEEICKDIDIAMSSASLIKLPIMVEVYYQAHEGKLSLDERVVLDSGEAVGGSGIICMLDDKAELSIRDLVTLMITLSDNTAANKLMDIVGIENVNSRMEALGLEHTELHNKLMLTPASPELKNLTSAGDMARLLELLYYGEIVNREASDAMLEIMTNQTINDKLAFYVEAYAPMAHKTGDTSTTSHDVGIVFSDVPYIICLMSQNVNIDSFNAYMRELSLNVYNYTMSDSDERPAALWESNIKDEPADKIVMAWDTRPVEDAGGLPQAVNVLAPVWFEIKADASGEPYADLMELDHRGYVDSAHQSGKEVWVTVSSFDKECNRQLLKNEDLRRKICEGISSFVRDNDVDGLCLDFEYMDPANKGDFTAFVSFLSEMLPADVKLSACVTVQLDSAENNWYQCYDHKGLAEVCDYICLMAYDQFNLSSEEAGPVAALDWTEYMLQQELVDVPSDKLILGVPFYYYAYPYHDSSPLWPDTDVSIFTWSVLKSIEDTGEYVDKNMETIIPEILEDAINEPSGMRLLKLRDQYGILRICYADTEESLIARCRLIGNYHLKGAAVWKASYGTDVQWALLNQQLITKD